MDGAQEVERKRAAYAVSAIVHTLAWRRVSFGEPAENVSGGSPGEAEDADLKSALQNRWTNRA
jgi:hypothetical protein